MRRALPPIKARAALLAVIAAGAVAGCGDLSTPPKGTDPTRPYRLPERPAPISLSEIAQVPANTPRGALLRWFRALQVGDLAAARRLYAPDVRPSLRHLRASRRAAGGLLTQASFDRVLDVTREGTTATVFTLLVRNMRAPNGQDDRYTLPQGFALRRVGGRWLIADDFWLDQFRGAAG